MSFWFIASKNLFFSNGEISCSHSVGVVDIELEVGHVERKVDEAQPHFLSWQMNENVKVPRQFETDWI